MNKDCLFILQILSWPIVTLIVGYWICDIFNPTLNLNVKDFNIINIISLILSLLALVNSFARQKLQDAHSISITEITDDAIVKLCNSGQVPVEFSITLQTLDDGISGCGDGGNNKISEFILLNPGESFSFHSFHIAQAENCKVFCGIIQIEITKVGNQLKYIKREYHLTFSGDKCCKKDNFYHPNKKWTIRKIKQSEI